MKTTITHSEYLALCGVLSLGQSHSRKAEEFTTCAMALLGIGNREDCGGPNDDAYYTIHDAIWGDDDWSADTLLAKLDITVETIEVKHSPDVAALMIQLLAEINEDAARDIEAGNPITGAHDRAMQRAVKRLEALV